MSSKDEGRDNGEIDPDRGKEDVTLFIVTFQATIHISTALSLRKVTSVSILTLVVKYDLEFTIEKIMLH